MPHAGIASTTRPSLATTAVTISILAVAVVRQLPLVTRNRRDFEALAEVSGARLSLLNLDEARTQKTLRDGTEARPHEAGVPTAVQHLDAPNADWAWSHDGKYVGLDGQTAVMLFDVSVTPPKSAEVYFRISVEPHVRFEPVLQRGQQLLRVQ